MTTVILESASSSYDINHHSRIYYILATLELTNANGAKNAKHSVNAVLLKFVKIHELNALGKPGGKQKQNYLNKHKENDKAEIVFRFWRSGL